MSSTEKFIKTFLFELSYSKILSNFVPFFETNIYMKKKQELDRKARKSETFLNGIAEHIKKMKLTTSHFLTFPWIRRIASLHIILTQISGLQNRRHFTSVRTDHCFHYGKRSQQRVPLRRPFYYHIINE